MLVAMHADGRELRGNERQLVLIINGLVSRGHELHCSCMAGTEAARAYAAAGAHITGTRPRGDLDVFSALQFARWLRHLEPDALLLTSWKRLVVGAAAARLARVPRVVARIGGVHGMGRGPRGPLTRAALRGWVDALYVNSAEVRAHLLAAVPRLDPQRVIQIPNAVPSRELPPAPLRMQLGLPPHAHLVLGVGGLERRKGFDLAVRALVAPGLETLHLVLAGSGGEAEQLRALAAELDVGPRVHLLGHRSDVPALLGAADIFVLPSRREGMPVALMEAMAAGVPAVAARAGGVPELLGGDPLAGWLVPVNDAAALADALRQALADPADARARAHLAAHRVRTEYTVERLVSSVEKLLAGHNAELAGTAAGG
jgi:glycosyltransferase involved in cell wall biosynthesis